MRRFLSRCLLAAALSLGLALPAGAQSITYGPGLRPDASNATLPDALANLGDPIFYARNYGVVDGSSSDQSAAAQLALNACGVAGGGEVVFGKSTYFVKGLSLPNNCTVRGQGMAATTLKLPNSSNTYIIASSTYINNQTFANLYGGIREVSLDGNKSNNVTGSLFIMKGYRTKISRVAFNNAAEHGLLYTSFTADASENANGEAENTVEFSVFSLNGGAGFFADNGPGQRISDAWIVDSVFYANGASSSYCNIYLERSAGFHIRGNQLYDSPNCDLYAGAAGNTKIVGNDFDGTLNVANGTAVNQVTIVAGGYGTVALNSNTFKTLAAGLGSATAWNMINFQQVTSDRSSVIEGNTFHSQDFRVTNTVLYSGTGTSTLRIGTNGWAANAPMPSATATVDLGQIPIPPQGRLTLTSGAPVMTTGAAGATTVYYAPYQGATMPISDGSGFRQVTFSELSLALDSDSGHTGYQASGGLFDVFGILDSGAARICTGPAWASATSRGTGAGTTQVSQATGIWVNAVSIVCRFGSASGNTVTVAAGQATLLGTMYATANGQTTMTFAPAPAAGGGNAILGLYNAYNRVPVVAASIDNTTSWTYATPTWQAANASNSNRITFVDGLAQSFLEARFSVPAAATSTTPEIGINIDSTSATPTSFAKLSTAGFGMLTAHLASPPRLGLHYVQAVEFALTAATVTFNAPAALLAGISM